MGWTFRPVELSGRRTDGEKFLRHERQTHLSLMAHQTGEIPLPGCHRMASSASMRAMKTLPSVLSACLFAAAAAHAEVTAVREGSQLVFRSGGREIVRYQAEAGDPPRPDIPAEFRRGGYLQSIRTPAGTLVTDDYPADHKHHHGVWMPWTKTEFEGRHPDFWNMGQKTGRVEFVALDEVWHKDGRAGFTARHQFIDMTAKPEKTALLETWNVTLSDAGGVVTIDLDSTQRCAGSSPLRLPVYHYGGFGFRGSAAWIDKADCRFLTASGLTDRAKVNTAREKWCWVGGKVDGRTCGVALLCHPSNFRFPQPIRANPDQPFFCYAPQQAGEMEIVPGSPYRSRYRIIPADGEPDATAIDRAWHDYTRGTAEAK